MDAEQIERPFRNGLAEFGIGLANWIRNRSEGLQTECARAAEQAKDLQIGLADLEDESAAIKRDYRAQTVAGDPRAAQIAADAWEAIMREKAGLEEDLATARSVVQKLDAAVPDSELALRLHSDLERGLAKHIQGNSAGDLNARLREVLKRVVMTPLKDGSVRIEPELSASFVAMVEREPNTLSKINPLRDVTVGGNEGDLAMCLEVPPPLRRVRVHRRRIVARTKATTEARYWKAGSSKSPCTAAGSSPPNPDTFTLR